MKSNEPVNPNESEVRKQIEAVAMSKVCDLETTPFVTHATYYGKLPDILREGIIAGDFAQRIGKGTYISEFGAQQNVRSVSTIDQSRLTWGNQIAIVIKKGNGILHHDDLSAAMREMLIKNRVAPREFMGMGISVPEIHAVGHEQRLQKAIEGAIEIWKGNPGEALPVYDILHQGLIWPTRMTHEELVEWLARDKSGVK